MALFELLCCLFAVGGSLLLGGLVVDRDLILDVLDGLVDLSRPGRGEEVDLLELVDGLDVVREVLFLLLFLLGWLLVLRLLLLVGLALLRNHDLGASLQLLLPLLPEDHFSSALLAVVHMVLDWL